MFASGDRASWLNAIAGKIMDGGAMPPSLDRLNIIIPMFIATKENDGHVTAAAALGEKSRADYKAGWRIIIQEMVTLLREQGFVGGSDDALTWMKPLDGTWKVTMPDKDKIEITIFGQKERRDSRDRAVIGERDENGKRVGVPSLFESGKMRPLDLIVEGARGKIARQQFEIHPLANLMPSYTQAEREGLRASIERDGVEVPVVIYQKKILDGRNRSYFAQQFKKPVRIVEFTGTEEEARRHVITLNLVRRHLTPAQQQLLANQLFAEESKKEAAESYKQKVGRPKKPAQIMSGNRLGNSEAISSQSEWPAIAARKAKEVGLTSATADGIRLMELVKDAPETLAKVENQEIKNPSRAAAKAREEKGKPKAATFEGARTRSLTKHTGEILYHFRSMLTDLEMPLGTMPQKISERLDENDRLNAQLRKVLRERKVIP